MLIYILIVLSAFFTATMVLWLFFIALAKITEGAENLSDLPVWKKILVIAFAYLDVRFNYTYAAVLFLDFANSDRKTLTARLKHILHSGNYAENEWRFKLALFMCKYMIEPWDYGHCSLRGISQ